MATLMRSESKDITVMFAEVSEIEEIEDIEEIDDIKRYLFEVVAYKIMADIFDDMDISMAEMREKGIELCGGDHHTCPCRN
ncbi:hypothetical protein [European catfish virus]|uniref:Uncharacterized protein n=1 Tax=European catfish virus TaxID=84739 RepID=I2BFL6_9VIRU|nr:hypothetical protein A190_gp036 [European catfish virus]AFJ52319.1 hypothetical protein [European catfish virus]AMZ04865.1 hypothetical protein [European catfish virus]AMZ05001.1 hypothetical protein [European catfish virus]